MCKVLIFGGTTEGRLLAEYCHEHGIRTFVSVISGYGVMLLPESSYLRVVSGRLTAEEMTSFMRGHGIRTVFDATHPYAFEATGNIRAACGSLGVNYNRVVREETGVPEEWGGKEGRFHSGELSLKRVSSMEEAVSFLEETEGRILVTTGSSKLHAFLGLTGYAKRIYARVLPTGEAIAACEELGLSGSRIIAMQGPFSEEMNRATMRQLHIRYLVTKETGGAGGFLEKLSAVRGLPVTAVIIGRPAGEEGISVDQAARMLSGLCGGQKGDGKKEKGEEETKEKQDFSRGKRLISLIGAGMGGRGQLTVSAAEELKRCDVIFGAPRLMETAVREAPGARWVPLYEGGKILSWLEEQPGLRRPGVLFSGDTGFYSGAGGLASKVLEEPYCNRFEVRMLPGISTVSCLCARVNRGWERVKLLSLHGRQSNVSEVLNSHPEVFVLLGGENTVGGLCGELMENGFGEAQLIVGERLSYPDERVTCGKPAKLRFMEFDSLAAVLILRAGERKVIAL